MKNILKYLFAFLMIALSACKDEETAGLSILPEGDRINTIRIDSSTLILTTNYDATIQSDENTVLGLSLQLGNYIDPVFGRTSASFYSNVNIGFTPSFGDVNGLAADSLVLTLDYSTVYGSTDGIPLHVKAYEMLETMDLATEYKNDQYFKVENSAPIADQVVNVNSEDSITIDAVKLAPHMRIRLSPTLSQRIIQAYLDTNLSTNADWQAIFKGLYVTTENVNNNIGGAIAAFNPLSTLTGVTLYYHNNTNDSLKYYFSLAGNSRVNHYDHDYSIAQQSVKTALTNPTVQYDNAFVQGFGGIKIKLQIPFLKQLNDLGSIVVNKAELVLPVENGSNITFKAPSRLLLSRLDSDNSEHVLQDYLIPINQTIQYDGYYSATDKAYHIVMTNEVQKILRGVYTSTDFILSVPFIRDEDYQIQSSIDRLSSYTPSRAILTSGNNTNKPKLIIDYSLIN